MKLTRESEHGLKGLVFLAMQPPGTVKPVSEIAQAQALPRDFLAKIFRKFSQYGLVRSYRGKQRGYALARPPEAICLREVLEAVEGPDLVDRCIFWSSRCADLQPCLLHDWWKDIKPRVVEMLQRITLAELVEKVAFEEPLSVRDRSK
jgi:Rrf2 family protein